MVRKKDWHFGNITKKIIPRIWAGEREFAGENLCGADLSNLDLSGINFSEAY